MGYELIVTEKPSQAKKIAESLADSKPLKKNENGVNYYVLTHEAKDIVVASAVGHIYSLMEKDKSYNYPSYEISWKPAFEVSKNSSHTKKYINVIKKLAKNADSFTVATDFDIEGEVIGLNMIRYACNQKDANRMKFSTLTKKDLVEAYKNKMTHLDWGQANAGETRHFLDWFYGINLSRALSSAIRKAGLYKTLSSGRVQGPALKLIVDKEKEIMKFQPRPYWQISYEGLVNDKLIVANHEKDKFFDEEEAKTSFKKIFENDGFVKDITKKETKSLPPHPFDLTTLQTEAYRSLKISPKDTLAIAQELYTKGYTSYPRTSSQQLPEELGLKKLIENLKRSPIYSSYAEKLLKNKWLKPNNGKKKDPAHPAIYPTGIIPSEGELDGRYFKVYDLIVRRFLATFADSAVRETNKIILDVEGELLVAKGTRTIYSGWHEFYGPHVKLEEEELPEVKVSVPVKYSKAELERKETKPPKRYTPASLIKELEKRNLGTKATRAAIIDTLAQRNYVLEKSLEPTAMGIVTSDVMEKYVPDIVKEDLTRQFEIEMEEIREGKNDSKKVLSEAKSVLDKILNKFKNNDKEIGAELKNSLIEGQAKENTLGPCPICKEGSLMIKYSPRNRQHFIGCSNYPDCKAVFSLPGSGSTARSTDKICEACGFPLISIGSGRSQRIACFNPDCPKRKEEDEKQLGPELSKALSKPCPKCGSPLVLRKSMYGQFIGCSNYPKCKTIIQIPKDGGPIDMTPVEVKSKTGISKKVSKKVSKKSSKKVSKTD